MRLLHWFTRNWADTEDPDDPALQPLLMPMELAPALVRLEAAVRNSPRWNVESVDAASGSIHATRQTKLCKFVDDIRLMLEPVADGTRVHARSQSRIGFADLGQNRRNLLELWKLLEMLNQLPDL